MSEGEKARLVAWNHELRAVHGRLRDALEVARTAIVNGETGVAAARDLLLFCHGFCTALTKHHHGEDRHLFPALAAEHPELGETLRALRQDHSMIEYLITGLEDAVTRAAPAHELNRHLEGIAAIMENHFRYEERVLNDVLAGLRLDADTGDVLGPL